MEATEKLMYTYILKWTKRSTTLFPWAVSLIPFLQFSWADWFIVRTTLRIVLLGILAKLQSGKTPEWTWELPWILIWHCAAVHLAPCLHWFSGVSLAADTHLHLWWGTFSGSNGTLEKYLRFVSRLIGFSFISLNTTLKPVWDFHWQVCFFW